ncbi:hypothetical protein SDC9_192589 [bioreactor metagenome]|uniref:Uncharacterized protein n=1 Tax=bioreactor metagenome TaxID=1076179 RepID=A0A645I2N8_9ZZZZ
MLGVEVADVASSVEQQGHPLAQVRPVPALHRLPAGHAHHPGGVPRQPGQLARGDRRISRIEVERIVEEGHVPTGANHLAQAEIQLLAPVGPGPVHLSPRSTIVSLSHRR